MSIIFINSRSLGANRLFQKQLAAATGMCDRYHVEMSSSCRPRFQTKGCTSFIRSSSNIVLPNFVPVRTIISKSLSPIYRIVKERISNLFVRWEVTELAIALYCTVDKIDFNDFYTCFEMPDTFNSWFLIVELHIWMLMCCIMNSPQGSSALRNELIRALWNDVELKLKNLGKSKAHPKIKKQLKELAERLPITFLIYDEGLLSDDIRLAGGLWYKFFEKNCDDPEKMELLVHYVRHQLKYLNQLNLSSAEAVKSVERIWLPLPKEKRVSSFI